MKHLLLFVILIYILAGCNASNKSISQQSNLSIDFTYNDVFTTCFSIAFSQSDTAFIRQHFARPSSDSLKKNTSYYIILTKSDKNKLDSFIMNIPIQSLDTLYFQEYQDGVDYQFHFQNDSISKSIRVHSDNAPSALTNFRNWILDLKNQYKFYQIDTILYFESAKYVLPPPAPPPEIFEN